MYLETNDVIKYQGVKNFTQMVRWQDGCTKLTGKTPQNMPQVSNSHYHLLTKWLKGAANGNQEQPMMDLRLSSLKYTLNLKFPIPH